MGYRIRIEKVDEGAKPVSNFQPWTGDGVVYSKELPIEVIVSERHVSVNTLKAYLALLQQGKLAENVGVGPSVLTQIAAAHVQHIE